MSVDAFRHALILTGPTGSGKSGLALELAGPLRAEIVAMDSMTLYRGMDVGTAKPSALERERVPHHLVDVLDPWESASVAWWLERAAALCREISARGRRPLLVGGTALYLKAVLHGLFDGPPGDEGLRSRLLEQVARQGKEALHARLAEVDPASADRLHVNDIRRIVRALEVWELTGRPMSAWQTQWRGEGEASRLSAVTEDGLTRCLWLDLPREELYKRIDDRVARMVEDGLVAEVRRLAALTQPLGREARQALGYKEMFEHLQGRQTLAETVVQIQTRTRNFAKRQLTWFRSLQECQPADTRLTISLWGSRIESGG